VRRLSCRRQRDLRRPEADHGRTCARCGGAGGERIKRIASEARQDLERLFGGTIYLEVWVKVRGGWSDNEQRLKTYGYD
jgi:hypothetical protein